MSSERSVKDLSGPYRFEWWAWVDLNHQPRPYQGLLWCYIHSSLAVACAFHTISSHRQRGPAQAFSLFLRSFSKQLAMISSLRRAYPLPEILTIRSGNLK